MMKIYLDSIGCRLNQSEIERYSAHFRMAGHSLVSTPGESDLVVINTCTVTSKAAADSRSKVRRINRSNPRSSIVLTGCWSSLEESDALKLSGVSQIIPNEHKDDLVPLVLNLPPEIFDEEPVARQPIPGLRMRTRAFIKAQDGCDNQCTFCLTTIARGHSRSVHPDRVINEINAAVKGGVQEAVLTGVQLTSYGKDLLDPLDLKNLVERVFEDTELPRLRLSSLEPWNLPDEFLRLWENPRLCRQLHLPLQSGSASILRRMVRPITPQRYAKIIEEVRDLVPDIALTTDIISGFPGETQAEFEESLDFIRSMEFADGHTFTYSPRPGTAALRLPQHLPAKVTRERSRKIRDVVDDSAARYAKIFIGKTLTVLWESATALDGKGWEVLGLSDNYLRVRSTVPSNLFNTLSTVRIIGIDESGIHGEVIDSV